MTGRSRLTAIPFSEIPMLGGQHPLLHDVRLRDLGVLLEDVYQLRKAARRATSKLRREFPDDLWAEVEGLEIALDDFELRWLS